MRVTTKNNYLVVLLTVGTAGVALFGASLAATVTGGFVFTPVIGT